MLVLNNGEFELLSIIITISASQQAISGRVFWLRLYP